LDSIELESLIGEMGDQSAIDIPIDTFGNDEFPVNLDGDTVTHVPNEEPVTLDGDEPYIDDNGFSPNDDMGELEVESLINRYLGEADGGGFSMNIDSSWEKDNGEGTLTGDTFSMPSDVSSFYGGERPQSKEFTQGDGRIEPHVDIRKKILPGEIKQESNADAGIRLVSQGVSPKDVAKRLLTGR